MALKKTSKFGATEGLVFENNVSEENKINTAQETTTPAASEEYKPKIEFGSTQGKKGHKAPRINMAFAPEVHDWIKKTSRQQGISATELVNSIIKKEMNK